MLLLPKFKAMCSLPGFFRITQICTVNRPTEIGAALDLREPHSTDEYPGAHPDRPGSLPKFTHLVSARCSTISPASPSQEEHSFHGGSKLLFQFARTPSVTNNIWSSQNTWFCHYSPTSPTWILWKSIRVILSVTHEATSADRDDKPFTGGIKLMYHFIFTAIPGTIRGIVSTVLIVLTLWEHKTG